MCIRDSLSTLHAHLAAWLFDQHLTNAETQASALRVHAVVLGKLFKWNEELIQVLRANTHSSIFDGDFNISVVLLKLINETLLCVDICWLLDIEFLAGSILLELLVDPILVVGVVDVEVVQKVLLQSQYFLGALDLLNPFYLDSNFYLPTFISKFDAVWQEIKKDL